MPVALHLAPRPAPHRIRSEFVSWIETAGLFVLILVIVFAILGAPILHVLRFMVETLVRSLAAPR